MNNKYIWTYVKKYMLHNIIPVLLEWNEELWRKKKHIMSGKNEVQNVGQWWWCALFCSTITRKSIKEPQSRWKWPQYSQKLKNTEFGFVLLWSLNTRYARYFTDQVEYRYFCTFIVNTVGQQWRQYYNNITLFLTCYTFYFLHKMWLARSGPFNTVDCFISSNCTTNEWQTTLKFH